MEKTTRLFTVDSYDYVFEILKRELNGKTAFLKSKNFIFCEEKISLMAERVIASEFSGSFNTEVLSFGKFLKRHIKEEVNVLSKEGSAMAVNGLLTDLKLKALKQNGVGFSACVFELISQLKSAKVTPSLLKDAEVHGILKNKADDIAEIFSAYENFIDEKKFFDQSSLLSLLPNIIENDEEIKGADVFIVCYTSFTAQAREVIYALLKTAKSVTAILTGGKNQRLFVNETGKYFSEIAIKAGCKLQSYDLSCSSCEETKIIKDEIFSFRNIKSLYKTDKIFRLFPKNIKEETLMTASLIKAKVIGGGVRYSDFTVALPDIESYSSYIKSAFKKLGIPFFIDEKRKVSFHPMVLFIRDYIDLYIKNCDKDTVMSLISNPLFTESSELSMAFSAYVIKYNVNYGKFKKPFEYGKDIKDFSEIEKKRQDVVALLSFPFNIKRAILSLSVKEKIDTLTEKLSAIGENEEAALNSQVYDKIMDVLSEMERLSFGKLSYRETKKIFLSAIEGMELSIIPQYSDAVFIGGYRTTALSLAKYLFALGLDSSVPNIQEDTALLSDGDIVRLERAKVSVEPKISIVNRRNAEKAGLALSAFTTNLFLSCPTNASNGAKNESSEILKFFEKRFTLKALSYKNEFLTKKAGLYAFARSCSEFAEGKKNDIDDATCYYFAVNKDEKTKELLSELNAEIKQKLDSGTDIIVSSVNSPTAIEQYFSCPYKSFLTKVLKAKEEETGDLSERDVGNVIHEFLAGIMLAVKEGKIKDEESFYSAFSEEEKKISEKEENKKFSETPSGKDKYLRIVKEAEKFCKTAVIRLKDTEFFPMEIEAKIGDDKYPLALSKGKYKLYGKVDRVDNNGDFIRIVDYKTGTAYSKAEALKDLFAGEKMQMYLYAKAFSDKTPVEIAYEYINDKYVQDEKKSAISNFMKFDEDDDLKNESAIKNRIAYAVAVSEKALSRMEEGVIIPSHLKGACDNCIFKGACDEKFRIEREIGTVTDETIEQSLTEKGI